MQRVVVDANVFLSFLVQRNDKERDLAKALFAKAEDGELVVILPQFVVFEIVYVLQSAYSIPAEELATLTRDLRALPGVHAAMNRRGGGSSSSGRAPSPPSPMRRSSRWPPHTDMTRWRRLTRSSQNG